MKIQIPIALIIEPCRHSKPLNHKSLFLRSFEYNNDALTEYNVAFVEYIQEYLLFLSIQTIYYKCVICIKLIYDISNT